MIVKTGFEDSFSPFSVEMINQNEMKWTREEAGAMVTVFNRRITEIPKSPATKAVGLWRITEVLDKNLKVTEQFTSEEFQAVFVRWDNLIQEITTEGRRSGIWRVDAHRSVIDILYYDGEKSLQYWSLDFASEDQMTWTRDGLTITFERLTTFPED
ncbi:MAG: hypothetical protein JJ895_02235 [Balneolaceae bacterium]|nr:hypothetical protein [Balneolaceae bacterium]